MDLAILRVKKRMELIDARILMLLNSHDNDFLRNMDLLDHDAAYDRVCMVLAGLLEAGVDEYDPRIEALVVSAIYIKQKQNSF